MEVKEALFLTASASATNAAVKGTLPKTAEPALAKSTPAQGGQQEEPEANNPKDWDNLYPVFTASR